MIDLTDEQNAVADAALSFIHRPWKKDLRIGGLAGTGKTVLINHLRRKTETNVCAFTGKAANVLRGKGVDDARTIHSLIYVPDADEEGDVNFKLKEPHTINAPIIVDEASMVTRQLYEDLLSFEVPLLFIGDHGQLEPVGDNPKLMLEPDHTLEQIHRQAAGSPIIRFAHAIRNGDDPMEAQSEANEAGRVDVVIEGRVRLSEIDQAIVAFNKRRVELNARFRKAKGFEGQWPVVGDRLICLRNEKRAGLFNGLQATVKTLPELQGDWLTGEVETEDGRNIIVNMLADQFNAERAVERAPRRLGGNKITLWDYGYAVTCHKAQGSEFDTVMVVDTHLPRKWDERRWRYTAATRAAKRLVWRVI